MSARANLAIIVVGLLAILVYTSVFTVSEKELAIKFQFGRIVREDYQPGLQFKWPLVNNVIKFDKRILTRDNPSEEFLTNEKKNLIVDFFIKYRIADVGQYYRATAGNEARASQRLLENIKDGIRGEFAKRTVQQVVTADRAELMEPMMARAQQTADEFGIKVVDVRVKRIDLPDAVSESVFNRMRQERARFAAQLRAEGAEASERIQAEADRDRTVILAEAYRDAQLTRGEGDARSAEIYATAYEENPEFFFFHRRLEAYRKAMGREQDILVLSPDSEFFRYLTEPGPSDSGD